MSETDVWILVKRHWKETNRLIIHIDDSNRLGRTKSIADFQGIRDKIAELQDWQECPFGILISGTPDIANLFEGEEGGHRRLTSTVNITPMSDADLKHGVPEAIKTYANIYNLKVEIGPESDFLQRHGHACGRAFGRSLEYIMDAVTLALFSRDKTVRASTFADALSRRYGWPPEANPYLAAEWWQLDPMKILGNGAPKGELREPASTRPSRRS